MRKAEGRNEVLARLARRSDEKRTCILAGRASFWSIDGQRDSERALAALLVVCMYVLCLQVRVPRIYDPSRCFVVDHRQRGYNEGAKAPIPDNQAYITPRHERIKQTRCHMMCRNSRGSTRC